MVVLSVQWLRVSFFSTHFPLVSLLHSIASARLVKAFNSTSVSCLPSNLPMAPWPFSILRNLLLICLNMVSFFQGWLLYNWAVVAPSTASDDPTNEFNLDFPNFYFQFTRQYKLGQCHKSSSAQRHVMMVSITDSISKHERLGTTCMRAQQKSAFTRLFDWFGEADPVLPDWQNPGSWALGAQIFTPLWGAGPFLVIDCACVSHELLKHMEQHSRSYQQWVLIPSTSRVSHQQCQWLGGNGTGRPHQLKYPWHIHKRPGWW